MAENHIADNELGDYAIGTTVTEPDAMRSSPVENHVNDPVVDESQQPLRCFGCGRIIDGEDIITVLNGIYHKNCFSCQFCRRVLGMDQFAVEDGRPCCDPRCEVRRAITTDDEKEKDEALQWRRTKEYCYTCGKVIETSEFVRAFEGIFHTHCFCCQSCHRPLKVGSCTVIDGKLHCDPTCEKTDDVPTTVSSTKEEPTPVEDRLEKISMPSIVDRQICAICRTQIPDWDCLDFDQKSFHRSCFRCRLCNRRLDPNKFQLIDGERCCYPSCLEYHQTSYSRMFVRPSSISTPTAKQIKTMCFVPSESTPNSHRVAYSSAPVSTRQSHNDLFVYDGVQASPMQPPRKRPERASSLVNDRLCYTCGRKVYVMEQLHVMDRYYHRSCFRCEMCNRILDIVRFSVHEGRPYCIPHHYHVSRNRSFSATNLRSHYPETEYSEATAKPPSRTETPTPQPTTVKQHISRAQTLPAHTWNGTKNRFSEAKVTPRVRMSPLPLARVETSTYVEANIPPGAPTPCSPTTVTSKAFESQIGEPQGMEKSHCFTCGRIVHPYLRIALPDKVYHLDCAKCYICQISLGLSNYRDLEGKLYCSPHYSQARAELMEYSRKPPTPRSVSMSGLHGEVGRNTTNNHADHSFSERTSEKLRNSWGSSTIHKLSTTALYSAPKPKTPTINGIHSNSVEPPASPTIPPRPRLVPEQAPPAQETIQYRPFRSMTPDMSRAIEPLRKVPMCGLCSICTRPAYPNNSIDLGGKPVHVDCLGCHVCGARLDLSNYKELDGKAVCAKDYVKLEESKVIQEELRRSLSAMPSPATTRKISVDKTVCFACGKKAYAMDSLFVMERVYHKFCFKCQKCHGTLGVENYHVLDGNPYCKSHYKQLLYYPVPDTNRVSLYTPASEPVEHLISDTPTPKAESTLCRTCQLPVHAREAIHILQQYYHYDCFKCEHCDKKLNMGRFEMAQGKAYCPEDFLHIYGRNRRNPQLITRGISARHSSMYMNELVRSRSAERPRVQSFCPIGRTT